MIESKGYDNSLKQDCGQCKAHGSVSKTESLTRKNIFSLTKSLKSYWKCEECGWTSEPEYVSTSTKSSRSRPPSPKQQSNKSRSSTPTPTLLSLQTSMSPSLLRKSKSKSWGKSRGKQALSNPSSASASPSSSNTSEMNYMYRTAERWHRPPSFVENLSLKMPVLKGDGDEEQEQEREGGETRKGSKS
ncbi:hypothetical protein GYMLUDRAFT_41043, partial [Collybiopsis luxurians FD-317 M1]